MRLFLEHVTNLLFSPYTDFVESIICDFGNQNIGKGANSMQEIIGLISVIMVFSIPLTALILGQVRGTQKLKAKMLKDELELEKLKGENFIAETEKMRLELNQTQLNFSKSDDSILLGFQKDQIKSI